MTLAGSAARDSTRVLCVSRPAIPTAGTCSPPTDGSSRAGYEKP